MIVVRSGPENTSRVEEALRLSAAMLGFDRPITIVFLDDGIRCLYSKALRDKTLQDYLQAVSDLAGLFALVPSKKSETGFDPALEIDLLDINELVTMMKNYSSVATF